MAKSETIAILRRYQTVFSGRRQIEPEGWLIYAEALADIQPDVVKMAMDKLVLTADWFPSVKEIREAAEGLVRHSNGTGLPTPEEAWEEAMRLNRGYGPNETWPYSCPEVKQAVKVFGGQMEMAMIPAEGLGTARAQFKKAYESVLTKERDRAANEAVLGPDLGQLGEAARRMLEEGA